MPQQPIYIVQLNSWVGDLAGNAEKIERFVGQAPAGALVIFPELALTGYPPRDLVDWDSFRAETLNVCERLQNKLKNSGRDVIYGSLGVSGTQARNRAIGVMGNSVKTYDKQLLPFYDVFDESRHFEPGPELQETWKTSGGLTLGLSICEDIWNEVKLPHLSKFLDRFQRRPMKQGADLGAELLVNLSASPFERKKGFNKEAMVGDICKKLGKPILYVNGVGGNDDIILDGGTFLVGADGDVKFRAPLFEEGLFCVKPQTVMKRDQYEIFDALKLGIRDYFEKSGQTKALVGLSGGIDSAVVLRLLVAALGPNAVSTVFLPSIFSSELSRRLASEEAHDVGVRFEEISIETILSSVKGLLGNYKLGGLVSENLQSRARGLTLMTIANATDSLLVATSNKSEIAVGYCTLYGDTNGAFAPLGDLTKSEVVELAKVLGVSSEIISRPPSAELRENQKDSDSLPEYEELDPMVTMFTLGRENPKNTKISSSMHRMEFKRRQMPMIFKLSQAAFGPGRRMPINHAFIKS